MIEIDVGEIYKKYLQINPEEYIHTFPSKELTSKIEVETNQILGQFLFNLLEKKYIIDKEEIKAESRFKNIFASIKYWLLGGKFIYENKIVGGMIFYTYTNDYNYFPRREEYFAKPKETLYRFCAKTMNASLDELTKSNKEIIQEDSYLARELSKENPELNEENEITIHVLDARITETFFMGLKLRETNQ